MPGQNTKNQHRASGPRSHASNKPPSVAAATVPSTSMRQRLTQSGSNGGSGANKCRKPEDDDADGLGRICNHNSLTGVGAWTQNLPTRDEMPDHILEFDD